MAVSEQQHGLVFQGGGADFFFCRQRMVARHRRHEWLVVQGCSGKSSIWKRLGQDGAIDLAGTQHL